ncbi:MAG: FAD-binding oxidoreductase [Pseudomonadota bacterium]
MTVAVIGAGIVGISTALHLKRGGANVVLIDREGPAAGASYGNAGLLASSFVIPTNGPTLWRDMPGYLLRRDSPLFVDPTHILKALPWIFGVMRRANRKDARTAAHAMAPLIANSPDEHLRLAKDTPAERFIVHEDMVGLYASKHAYEKEAFAWKTREELDLPHQLIDIEALREQDPFFAQVEGFPIIYPNHGHIKKPGAYVQALSEHFQTLGGQVVKAEVSGFATENGKIRAVKTDQDDIPCETVVLAAGAWSKDLMKALGIDVPLIGERGYHLEFVNPSIMPKTAVMMTKGKFGVAPMEDRLRCAGLVEIAALDASPNPRIFRHLEKTVRGTFPKLTFERIERWVGPRPTISDYLPAIGAIKTVSNGYAAFGHQHLGLTAGPRTGRILADMILGSPDNYDWSAFDPNRFKRAPM